MCIRDRCEDLPREKCPVVVVREALEVSMALVTMALEVSVVLVNAVLEVRAQRKLQHPTRRPW